MKVKNLDLVAIVNVFDKYADKRLPQKISYAITKNIMSLENDYKCYQDSLNKLLKPYEEHFTYDESNNIIQQYGIPILDDTKLQKELISEINDLLDIEVDITLFTIDEKVFDYDDTEKKYDTLSPKDILELQSVLCKKEDDKDEEPEEN